MRKTLSADRPALAAASAIRSRTAAIFERISEGVITVSIRNHIRVSTVSRRGTTCADAVNRSEFHTHQKPCNL